jgi:hypothetical protein
MEYTDFGYALVNLHRGYKLQREGWNGKGMYIVLQRGYPEGIAINKNTAGATGILQGTVCKFRPYLMMFTAQGDFVPWVASQTDLLADDWGITV